MTADYNFTVHSRSQFCPMNPALHEQTYAPTFSVQTPPFRHGFGSHLLSTENRIQRSKDTVD